LKNISSLFFFFTTSKFFSFFKIEENDNHINNVMIIVVLNLVKQGYNLTDTDQYPLKHNIAPLNMDVSLSIFLAYATSLNIGLLDSILGKYSLGFLLHDTKSTT